jgi:hypothetical protein
MLCSGAMLSLANVGKLLVIGQELGQCSGLAWNRLTNTVSALHENKTWFGLA